MAPYSSQPANPPCVSVDDDDNDVVDADADDLHLPLPTLQVSAMTKFSQNRLSLLSTNGVDVEDNDVDDNNDILDGDDPDEWVNFQSQSLPALNLSTPFFGRRLPRGDFPVSCICQNLPTCISTSTTTIIITIKIGSIFEEMYFGTLAIITNTIIISELRYMAMIIIMILIILIYFLQYFSL